MKREEKKQENQLCKKHNRSQELFCFLCKSEDEPMCPLCMCAHQNEVHKGNTVHITTIIDKVLAKVSELMKDGVKHQEVITQHNARAEKLITEKEKIRFALDERLESLMVFYTQQKGIVAENNAAMLKSHERILKETQKAEYRINENLKNPEKIPNRVKEMIAQEHYWPALAEAKRAHQEEVDFNDDLIKDELEKSEQCLQGYKNQLATLDIKPLHNNKYNSLLADKESLLQQNAKQEAEIRGLIDTHAKAISRFD